MKLLIDIGNTRLKWALASTAELLETGTIFHEGEPAARLHALPKKPVEAIWLTHVIGADHEPAIIENLHARYGLAPRLARVTESWNGLRNAYREPRRLGVDRWLAMIAAWQDAGRAAPICVVDAGTALTADAIAQDGAHLGGIIAAGLQTQQRAVLAATHIAARDTAAPFTAALGTDTESCVRQGALLACLGAIDRAAAAAGPAARCIITGGDAASLLAHLPGHWLHDPLLVLRGLNALSESP
jgi:type III pantothenate kinase